MKYAKKLIEVVRLGEGSAIGLFQILPKGLRHAGGGLRRELIQNIFHVFRLCG